jgi:hypothetical protein
VKQDLMRRKWQIDAAGREFVLNGGEDLVLALEGIGAARRFDPPANAKVNRAPRESDDEHLG